MSPFKKKDTYKPVSLEPEVEQTGESPEAKGEAGRPPKGTTKQRHALSKFSVDSDVLDVWERRMLNPNGTSTPLIHITTPGMKLRWINCEQSGRFHRARNDQGWVPVEKDELKNPREIYGVTYTTEGYVCRGPRQQEMLMKMPASVWKEIEKRRAEINKKSYQTLKAQLASGGAQRVADRVSGEHGDAAGRIAADQAAEAAMNFRGNISFGEERVGSDEAIGGGFE